MVNKVIIIGRVGQNPEVRQTSGGSPVTNFSVATNEKWTDKSGQKQEHAEWHKIVAWGNLAEICGQYLNKGALAYFEGKLQTREYTDKAGIKKLSTEVQVSVMQILSSRKDQERSDAHEESSGLDPSAFGV